MSTHADCELAVRVEELEVRMMRMENVQDQILASIRHLSTQLHSQYHYQTYPLKDPYSQFQSRLPAQHSNMQHHQIFSFGVASGAQPSSEPAPQLSPYLPTTSTYPQQSPQSNHFRQHDLSAMSDPGMVSSVTRDSVQPCRVPPLPSNASATLPSSEIARHTLRSVDEVLEENAKLRTESTAGTLCQKLAKEAIFGKAVMKKCTPNGTREFPALPREELYKLKTVMFKQFPRYRSCPGAFESLWKKCMTSIEQACKRLRTH